MDDFLDAYEGVFEGLEELPDAFEELPDASEALLVETDPLNAEEAFGYRIFEVDPLSAEASFADLIEPAAFAILFQMANLMNVEDLEAEI